MGGTQMKKNADMQHLRTWLAGVVADMWPVTGDITAGLPLIKAHMARLTAWEREQRAAGYSTAEIAGALRKKINTLKAQARKTPHRRNP
jgi:hypothetical protein